MAVRGFQNRNYDIWVHEAGRPIKSRISVDPAFDAVPVWSPSGERIAFTSLREGNADILAKPADGSGEATALAATPFPEKATDWSDDGNYILYERRNPETGSDLWYLRRDRRGGGFEQFPFLQTPFHETAGSFSPDGRYVAYVSNESGDNEIYIQPFPHGGAKVEVSTGGGMQPRWSKDGTEVFYVAQDALMAAAVRTSPTLRADMPALLFRTRFLPSTEFAHYDVTADGQRFVIPEPLESEKARVIRVVENWYEEFRDRR